MSITKKTLKESILRSDGKSVTLFDILSRPTCPLTKNAKKNLLAVNEIRDEVEHRIFGKSDVNWLSLFQACCVNFENTLCDLFGKHLSLHPNLSFALQFARVSLSQISETQELAVPANIQSLDARLNSDIDDSDPSSSEYKFRVVYTLDSSAKTGSNIKFISPESHEGQEIHNVLIKTRAADDAYPLKPSTVVKEVKKKIKTFSSHSHQLAWKRHKARPRHGVKKPEQTNRTYCIFHSAHGDYTYSQAWVDFLVKIYSDSKELTVFLEGDWP